ncbi:MAG: histidinol-phosphate transaminase, partial [Pyrinomonadaceae bacterium]
GIVVIDEAYIDFADEPSMISELVNLPNLVILQTFSKAWAMAGLRVGLAFASSPLIDLLNRVKPPYNVSGVAQQAVIAALDDGASDIANWIETARSERQRMTPSLSGLSLVQIVYPSNANFLLAKVTDAAAIYRFLLEEGIVVRDRSQVELCEGCLRITVGTSEENDRLLEALRRFEINKK